MENEFKNKLKDIEAWLSSEYKSVQTGRATPSVLDIVYVEQYGSKTQLSHTASINIEDARSLKVTPWDKSIIREIEKAINEADLGVSASSDSDGVRVHFPALTTETRVKLTKILKEKLEDARVKVRSAREDVKKEIERGSREGEYGKDDEKRKLEDMQKLVDATNASLENIYQAKEEDIMNN